MRRRRQCAARGEGREKDMGRGSGERYYYQRRWSREQREASGSIEQGRGTGANCLARRQGCTVQGRSTDHYRIRHGEQAVPPLLLPLTPRS